MPRHAEAYRSPDSAFGRSGCGHGHLCSRCTDAWSRGGRRRDGLCDPHCARPRSARHVISRRTLGGVACRGLRRQPGGRAIRMSRVRRTGRDGPAVSRSACRPSSRLPLRGGQLRRRARPGEGDARRSGALARVGPSDLPDGLHRAGGRRPSAAQRGRLTCHGRASRSPAAACGSRSQIRRKPPAGLHDGIAWRSKRRPIGPIAADCLSLQGGRVADRVPCGYAVQCGPALEAAGSRETTECP
jgi:hypothetical protein